jgi:uncharacterized protein (TIGR00369 family)
VTAAGRPVAAPGAVPFLPGAAEAAFGVTGVTGDRVLTVGSMDTGPWSIDSEGASCAGSLGVLIDDVLGYAVVSARPPGHWAVSTEIHADFGRALPAPGERLRSESSAVALGPAGGLASGVVRDATGGLIATATERLQYVPGEPGGLAENAAAALPMSAVVDGATSVAELLGVRRSGGGADAGLRFTPSEQLANPVGNLHGGVLFCAVELAGRSGLDPGVAPLVTSSVHLAFLRPLRLHAEVRLAVTVAHRGRTLGVAHVVATNPEGKVCALATVTGRGAP